MKRRAFSIFLVLTLITEDEYTLEEIDKADMPSGGGGGGKSPTPIEDTGYIELPAGCYAAYDGSSSGGYMKVTGRTIIIYEYDGYQSQECGYSYDRDGGCVLEDEDRGTTITVYFTYEQGYYYMSLYGRSLRLEPVSESEIPVYEGGNSGTSAPANGGTTGNGGSSYEGRYYIGGNGSMELYAYLPEETHYGPLTHDLVDEGFAANGVYYAAGTYYGDDILLDFDALLASGDFLQEIIAGALENTEGSYGAVDELLYDSIRDNIIRDKCLDQGEINIVGDFRGSKMTYSLEEGNILIGSRYWRCCDIFSSDGETEAYVRVIFWMDGYNMAVMVVTGVAEDSSRSDSMYNIVDYIINSVELEM